MNEATPLPGEIIIWLQTQSHSLHRLQSADSFDDLQPLKHMLGNVRIVALGEASHGTSEFARLKHRLLAFLIKEMGFEALGLEASWSEMLPLDTALREGGGHLERLLQQVRFWPWRTQEMLALLHWMRAQNEHRGSAPALRFFGFDMQEIHRAMNHVLMFLRHAAPRQEAAVKTLYEPVYRCVQKRDPLAYGKQPREVKALCHANVERAYTLLADMHPPSSTNSLETLWRAALQSARTVIQAETFFATETLSQDTTQWTIRDRAMAENVAFFLKEMDPEAKIVLWAHNGHIARLAGRVPFKPMGAYLREQFAEAYFPIGLTASGGSFHAWNRQRRKITPYCMPDAPSESYEYAFAQVEKANLLLDLRPTNSATAPANWLRQPHLFSRLETLYTTREPEHCFYFTSLPDEFDAIIAVQQISPSTLLKRRWLLRA